MSQIFKTRYHNLTVCSSLNNLKPSNFIQCEYLPQGRRLLLPSNRVSLHQTSYVVLRQLDTTRVSSRKIPHKENLTARGRAFTTFESYRKTPREFDIAIIEKIFSFMPNQELQRLFLVTMDGPHRTLRNLAVMILQQRLLPYDHYRTLDFIKSLSRIISLERPQSTAAPLRQIQNQCILKLDSERTFTCQNSQSKLKSLLENICSSSNTSYIQGINCIAAHALKNTKTQDDAFHLCMFIVKERKYQNLVCNDFKLLKRYNQRLEKEVKKNIPKLCEKLEEEGLDISILTFKWFITLFCNTFSRHTVNKIWVLFVLCGWPVIMDTAYTLLQLLYLKFVESRKRYISDFIEDYKLEISLSDQRTIISKIRRNWIRTKDIRPTEKKPGLRLFSNKPKYY